MQTTLCSSPPSMAEFRGFPLVGMVPTIARVGMLEFLTDAWEKNGDMFRVKIGPRTVVAMAHPDAIEHVLVKSRANYVKGGTYDLIRELTGAEGEASKMRRADSDPDEVPERIDDR